MSMKRAELKKHAQKEEKPETGKKHRSPAVRKEFLQSIAFLTPSVLGVTLFFVAPFGIVVLSLIHI